MCIGKTNEPLLRSGRGENTSFLLPTPIIIFTIVAVIAANVIYRTEVSPSELYPQQERSRHHMRASINYGSKKFLRL